MSCLVAVSATSHFHGSWPCPRAGHWPRRWGDRRRGRRPGRASSVLSPSVASFLPTSPCLTRLVDDSVLRAKVFSMLAQRDEKETELARADARECAPVQSTCVAALASKVGSQERHLSLHFSPVWAPTWTVLRDCDAFPGKNVGHPVSIKHLDKAKEACIVNGFSGIVIAGGACYLRLRCTRDYLLSAVISQEGADLMLPPMRGEIGKDIVHHGLSPPDHSRSLSKPNVLATDEQGVQMPCSRPGLTVASPRKRLRVAVVATQDEFQETAKLDSSTVSSSGNGRRFATQAMLRCLVVDPGIELVAVLLLDWKNLVGSSCNLANAGPCICSVSVCGGIEVTTWRGSQGQLIGAVAGELQVDVAISAQACLSCLAVLHNGISAKHYVVMGHDYNLPCGPWGIAVDSDARKIHQASLEHSRTLLLCTSAHLVDFIERFASRGVRAKLCYCADYGYFDSNTFPPEVCSDGTFVTFISPCPAKGLPIVLRLAAMLPDVQFLCVSTVWTKTIHVVQLRAFSNVQVVAGTSDIDSIYRRTAVLLMPSLWSEAFGLVAVEAQLRGIPVVSTDACGLRESNFLSELRIRDVRLVFDCRTRDMIRGLTMEEAEQRLDPLRPGPDAWSESQNKSRIELVHTFVATCEEVVGFVKTLRNLLDCVESRRSLGLVARERAIDFVQRRRGLFTRFLQSLSEDVRY
eukprot:TRINITY_DN11828_c0_g1_i1.p1 TRINITY_DN11828_c0_g1~~TRINITY_DN11828_c0_g1_i1.p1  ORF type:complete len:690 (+),score=92.04 TRINITY_DN11828_c0_g1_i1:388-2457(+)